MGGRPALPTAEASDSVRFGQRTSQRIFRFVCAVTNCFFGIGQPARKSHTRRWPTCPDRSGGSGRCKKGSPASVAFVVFLQIGQRSLMVRLRGITRIAEVRGQIAEVKDILPRGDFYLCNLTSDL